MDNQEELEKLIDKLMVSDTLETPSLNFTKKVLEKTISVKSERLVYRPLLPKWMLLLAVVVVVGFLVYGINLYITSGISNPYFKDLNKVGIWSSNFFSQFSLSKTMTYAIVISGLMVCLHTLVLKKYFENRLA